MFKVPGAPTGESITAHLLVEAFIANSDAQSPPAYLSNWQPKRARVATAQAASILYEVIP
jgi:hypothetical protein